MEIIPAMHLLNGRCVSVYKGDPENVTVLSSDPVGAARMFENQSATSILIIDGDTDSKNNREIAQKIAKNTRLAVTFADGISQMADIEKLFESGIKNIALRESAFALIPEAIKKFGPEKIWFLIRGERTHLAGKNTADVMDYGKKVADSGIKTIIFWDIKSEGTFHPNFDEIERLTIGTEANIIPFGGVGSMADIRVFKNTGAFGVAISRALFEKRLYLRNCIEKFST